MTSSNVWLQRIDRIRLLLGELEWLPQLLMRIFIGYFFLETGWGKIHNLDQMAQRFTDWGIPAPAFNAALSGYSEFLGGALVLIGLGTRLAALPLAVNMAVALVTVKLKSIDGINGFFELDEPLYGLAFLWLVFSGPGKASLDSLIWRYFSQQTRSDGSLPGSSKAVESS